MRTPRITKREPLTVREFSDQMADLIERIWKTGTPWNTITAAVESAVETAKERHDGKWATLEAMRPQCVSSSPRKRRADPFAPAPRHACPSCGEWIMTRLCVACSASGRLVELVGRRGVKFL